MTRFPGVVDLRISIFIFVTQMSSTNHARALTVRLLICSKRQSKLFDRRNRKIEFKSSIHADFLNQVVTSIEELASSLRMDGHQSTSQFCHQLSLNYLALQFS
jgi:hypothetical protein